MLVLLLSDSISVHFSVFT